MTTDLVTFLRARIDEDEAVAKAVVVGYHWSTGELTPWSVYSERQRVMLGDDYREADHVARHDPARVLAEVAAKRAIVEMHVPVHPDVTPTCQHVPRCEDETSWACPGCNTWDDDLPCPTLRHLATVYAAHEDYHEEWKP